MRKKRFGLKMAILGLCMLSVGGGISALAYTSTPERATRLQLAPAVVARVSDKAEFDAAVAAEEKAGSIILGVGKGCLTAENGDSAGGINEVFASLAKAGILPIINVSSSGDVAEIVQSVGRSGDFTLMSGNAEVLKAACVNLPEVRKIMDFSAGEREEKPYEYVRKSREAGAHAIVLSEAQADTDTVYYVQGLFTTVWVRAENESAFGFASNVSTGAYGIIAENTAELYATYNKYPSFSLPRGYYVAGHRGLPFTENENSLESCIAAFEAGATHLEIDVQTTKDNKLVVMHNETINATTNGKGSVANMTLEQIKQYKIVKSNGWQGSGNELEIPTLGEIYDYFKDKNVVIIVEIKDNNPSTCRLIKEEIEKYRMQGKTVAISFFDQDGMQIDRMHEIMPELPISTLNEITVGNFDAMLKRAAKFNMGFDVPAIVSYSEFMNSNFKNRGYASWSWTHADAKAAQQGITGLTHNYADKFSGYAKRLAAPDGLTVGSKSNIDDQTFTVEKHCFNGTKETVEAKVFMSEKTDGGYNAILYAEERDDENAHRVRLFTKPVFIAETQEGKKGCKSSVTAETAAGAGAASIAVSAAALMIPIGKRRIKSNETKKNNK